MSALLEFSELLRALAFPGSDILFVMSFALLALYLSTIRADISFWICTVLFAGIPLIYAITSGRAELASTAFSILSFFVLLKRSHSMYLIPISARLGIFTALVLLSLYLPAGEPIYPGSSFHSIFQSGNAFVYYVLLTACIIAFTMRRVAISAAVALPLAMIQTKSVVILTISSRLTLLLTLALMYPLYLYVTSLERISWFIEKYGVLYAIGSGRLQRFTERASSTFSSEKLWFGSPYPTRVENFEIEFIDFAHDFGVPFSLAFFTVCLVLLRKTANSDFGKVAAVFLLLNLSGHFWNNPLLIVIFTAFTHYVSNRTHHHVSGR